MEPRPSDVPADANPLRALSLDTLRRRTSMKWRTYPADVLPLWVAEMDVPLAAPVAQAIADAVAIGDTGYPAGTAYAQEMASSTSIPAPLHSAPPATRPRSTPTT